MSLLRIALLSLCSTMFVLAGEAGTAARTELKPCGPAGREGEVLCGTLQVPEDRDKTGGRQITLSFAVVKALEPAEGATPLFHLDGGPGVPATGAQQFYLDSGREYRRTRDVVLLDQRGTGGSNPLRCAALENRGPLAEMYPTSLVRACRAELEPLADLTQYGSLQAAADLDEVRSVLGYERIDIWALSYGTFLAQIYMRAYPERTRSAVFLGTVNMDPKLPLYHAVTAQRALDLVFFDCQADAECNAAHPNLRRDWEQLMRRLEQGPVQARRLDAATGQEIATELHRGPFAEALRSQMGTAASARRIPLIVRQAAQGDFAPFFESLRHDSVIPEGMYLSVACAEGAVRIGEEEVERFTAGTFLGAYRVRQQIRACREWPTAPLPDDLFQPVTVLTPVLIISGDTDNVTPPAWAGEVCAALPNCRRLVVPHLGHAPFDLDDWKQGECIDQIVWRFYSRPEPGTVDVSCLRTMRPPSYPH